ncbi:MAG: hypothetical protein HC821_04935 [Lewinella sp.]|nr:hypothetical protein [Lewinella sp.]
MRSKWKAGQREIFTFLQANLAAETDWTASSIKAVVLAFMEAQGLGFGAVLPILRVALSAVLRGQMPLR